MALLTVAEGTTNLMLAALPPAARTFAEAQLLARQSAAWSTPELVWQDRVSTAALSRDLFN